MSNFNSKFELSYATLINFDTMDEWEISGVVTDNSGTYFPSDSQVGDIIYIDSYEGIKRYVVTKIVSTSPQYVANVKWDMLNKEPFEPVAGYEGLIGASTENFKLTSLPSWTVNIITESFINNIKNYESGLIEYGSLNSPKLTGKPTAPTAESSSNDTQIANTEWVNKKIEDLEIQSTYNGEIKEFVSSEVIEKFKLVCLGENNKIKLCNANDVQNVNSIIGITLDSVDIDGKVNVLMEGIITNEAWNFDVFGKTLFAGLNGEFVKSIEEDYKFIQQIGLIMDNKTINLEIEEGIIL